MRGVYGIKHTTKIQNVLIELIERIEKEEEMRAEKMIAERFKNHKCRNCVWGTWQDKNIYCMFSKCFKDK